MTVDTHIAVIGGGASGLVCALRAAERYKDKRIIILEREDKVGKKILVSGNGKCNLSNINADRSSYCGNDTSLIDSLFENYSPKEVVKYFNSLGLLTYSDSEGRVYPRSNMSSSVLNTLRANLKMRHVKEYTGINIKDIRKTARGYVILTDEYRITAQKLVLAAGGMINHAGRKTDGSKNLLEMLGYKYTDLRPGLSSLVPVNKKTDSLKGIRTKGKVSLINSGRVTHEEYGEIQFSPGKISGICVFDISRFLDTNSKYILRISLLPEYPKDEILRYLHNAKALCTDSLDDLFCGMFHKNIGSCIIKECGISRNKKGMDLSDRELSLIADKVNCWEFEVMLPSKFENAQVTCGGIGTKEIDHKTFEAVKNKDLYILGETLDIDGRCGGFNLQFAFASGMCCADNL